MPIRSLDSAGFSVRATVMQTPVPGTLQVLAGARIVIGPDGTIEAVDQEAGPVDVELPSAQVLLPGLIDTHLHAPQWPQIGTRLDVALETWLFEHTFPLERRLTRLDAAGPVWARDEDPCRILNA